MKAGKYLLLITDYNLLIKYLKEVIYASSYGKEEEL